MVDMTAPATAGNEALEVFSSAQRRLLRKIIAGLGWPVVLLLIFVGLGSLFSRVGFMTSAFSQEVADPEAAFNAFDIRYVQHYLMVWSHLVVGFIVYAMAPFQFIPTIRKRWTKFHRWNGRVWLLCGGIAGFTGAFIGVVWPFTGHEGFGLVQTSINAIIGPYTLFCLYKAYSCVRAKAFGAHREWLVRSFALMLGVATQRALMLILIPATGLGVEVMFASMMVLGMVINIAVAEMWIQLTRTPGNGNRHWKDLDRQYAV